MVWGSGIRTRRGRRGIARVAAMACSQRFISTQVTVRDLQDSEKWAESRLKLDKFVDKIRPLEAYLEGRDYLSDGATIGW